MFTRHPWGLALLLAAGGGVALIGGCDGPTFGPMTFGDLGEVPDSGGCFGAPCAEGADAGDNGAVHPVFNATVKAGTPPPPISGGTLLVLRDGVTAVAADPDRDLVYVVDTRTKKLLPTRRRWRPATSPGASSPTARGGCTSPCAAAARS